MPIRDAGSGGSGSQDTPSGGYSADFLDYYSKIVGQNKDTGQWRRENNQLVDRKSRQQESGRVEMNDADKIARGAMQLSETIGSIGGLLNDENGNNWTQEKIKHGLSTGNFGEMGEGLLGFGMSLPFQMISAVPSGLASFYDAATGRKASSGDLESGTMESGELSGVQRLAAAGSGVIDTIGLGYGGSARMLGAMGKGVKAALGKEVTKEGPRGGSRRQQAPASASSHPTSARRRARRLRSPCSATSGMTPWTRRPSRVQVRRLRSEPWAAGS